MIILDFFSINCQEDMNWYTKVLSDGNEYIAK